MVSALVLIPIINIKDSNSENSKQPSLIRMDFPDFRHALWRHLGVIICQITPDMVQFGVNAKVLLDDESRVYGE